MNISDRAMPPVKNAAPTKIRVRKKAPTMDQLLNRVVNSSPRWRTTGGAKTMRPPVTARIVPIRSDRPLRPTSLTVSAPIPRPKTARERIRKAKL